MPRILTQARIEQFRSEICDAAATLYFEVGHSDFNMRDLAARVGVSAMTPYRYFGDKNGILAAVRARGFARLAGILEDASANGLTAVIQAYLNFAIEEAAYYRLIFDLSQPAGALAELLRQEKRMRDALSDVLAQVGYGPDATRLANTLWSSLHGVICLTLAGKLPCSELADLISRLVQSLTGTQHRFTVPALQSTPPQFNPAPVRAMPPAQLEASVRISAERSQKPQQHRSNTPVLTV